MKDKYKFWNPCSDMAGGLVFGTILSLPFLLISWYFAHDLQPVTVICKQTIPLESVVIIPTESR